MDGLDTRIEQRLANIPAAQAPPGGTGPDGQPAHLPAVDRLNDITGIGRHAAQAIIAEVGLSMAVFPHLRSPDLLVHGLPARRVVRCQVPRGEDGQGQTPPQKRPRGSRRSSRPRPTRSSGVATGAWPDASANSKPSSPSPPPSSSSSGNSRRPTARYRDLCPEFFDNRVRPERRKLNHIRQLEALGYKVTLEPAA